MGIKAIAITSDGEVFENSRYLSKFTAKLIREQRRLSLKQKSSKNRDKQRIKVARVHEKIANQRLDGIHKMTTELVKANDVICI
jgi:putative transposase